MSTAPNDDIWNMNIAELEALVDGKTNDDPNVELLRGAPEPGRKLYVAPGGDARGDRGAPEDW